MRVLVKQGEKDLADLSFKDKDVFIGSRLDCGIHLPDVEVSSRTALITPTSDGKWQIVNLDQENNLLLNNQTLTERKTLTNGDYITIRDFHLKIQFDFELASEDDEQTRPATSALRQITEFPLPAGAMVKRHFDPVTLKSDQIKLISKAGVGVGSCRDMHDLVDTSLDVLLEIFKARAVWIGIRREPQNELEIVGGKLASGRSCDVNPLIEQLQHRCLDRRQLICIRRVHDQKDIRTAMAAPLATSKGTLGMVYIDRSPTGRRFQIPDLDTLHVIVDNMAAKLEAIVEGMVQRNAELTSTEVSLIHAMQAQLDPKSSPVWDNLQMSAYSRSGQENPGDVFDVMKHPDTGITAFMLGHVNATGASLALSMARLQSVFRVGFLHNDPPHALARALNWLMYNEKDPSTVEALWIFVDPPSGKVKFARAGKMGAFIVNVQGMPRPLQGVNTPPVGQARNFEYNSQMEKLETGETLVLYSRGVATATNAENQRFTENRFIEMVCDGFCQPPATTVQDISFELTTFFEHGRHPDDITIVLLHRTQ